MQNSIPTKQRSTNNHLPTGISMLQTSTSKASTAPEITKTLNNQVFTTEVRRYI